MKDTESGNVQGTLSDVPVEGPESGRVGDGDSEGNRDGTGT